jgi:TonB family protein
MALAAAFVVSVLLGQAPSPPAAAPACNDTSGEAIAGLRRTASSMRDPVARKRAIEQLACIFDTGHLDQPASLDPLLRELIAISPGELTPVFRLAKLQERQELFDAAESTLLAARQQKPDDVAPYQELAQYFGRRVAAMKAAEKEAEKRYQDTPGPDGVYSVGGSIQAPEKISMESVPMPLEVSQGTLSGSVTIMAVVDATGRVTEAKILQSTRGLDDTALAAVKQWRFAPATLNGTPVPVRMPVVVRFGGGAI